MDPLTAVLDLSRVQGAVVANVCATAPWGLDLPQNTGASFHAVTAGVAWLRIAEAASVQLMPGDVLLLPRGSRHQLSSDPTRDCVPFERTVKQGMLNADGDLELGGGGAATTFICAAYDYDLESADTLLSALPDVIHLTAGPQGARDVAALVELLAGEVGAHRPGSRAAAARLLDALLIAAVRHWAATRSADDGPGWLPALRDPQIARVLALLHYSPSHQWTVDSLAREVHLSRAGLARRFSELVGEPPLTYLTRWRMRVAANRLKHSNDTVETIARNVGYTSEYAFNRAFARHRGQPPGRYRRLARAA